MNTRRSVAIALLLLVASILPARAEISAVIDGFGTYVQTAVLPVPGGKTPRIWAVQRRKLGYFPLNAAGDAAGDRAPLVAENLLDRSRPYVIWDRPNGVDLDLLWSQWTDAGWTAVAPVTIPTTAGDDIDPAVTFDSKGRAHLTWWRNQGETGRVYLTVFLSTIWMQEILVSDPLVDSRHPAVTVLADQTIEVSFDTPQGRMVRTVVIDWPVSINDDITPMNRVTISGSIAVRCTR